MKIKELLKIIDDVHKEHGTSQPYLCGGAPRDKYLGRLVSLADVDLTTGDGTINELSLRTYRELNKQFNIKRETKSDGHSSIYFKNIKIDFSSNYVNPTAKDFLIKSGKKPTPLLLESYSRDFGCNSMLLTLDLKDVLDPTGRGKEDCNKKIIKTLLSPEVTFKPNPKTQNNNRVVRSIYLASKLKFSIDPAIVEYVSKRPASITLSDPKTLAKKLNKAYELDPERTVHYLNKMNLWNHIPINGLLSDQLLDLLANKVNHG